MALLETLGRAIAVQRGSLLCWAPIFLSLGIGGYFLVKTEPGVLVYLAGLAGALLLAVLARWIGEDWRPVLSAIILILCGFMLAGLRAHNVAQPVLSYRYYGPIEGRIVAMDRSVSDAVRLTLDRVVLKRMSAARTPDRVRVSLHGQQGYIDPQPGMVVIMTGHLSPPSGPVEPGGFDFQRQAWFDGLGAVGYTRTPVLAFAPPERGGVAMRIYRLRMQISAAVRRAMPGRAGAFAAAVMTGDRAAMDRGSIADLRGSNLAHLLAISGLHMGLLTGLVFSLIRFLLAVVPPLALRLPTKKIAAACAIMAGAIYLGLSGGNVATERAFVMVSVMFTAVMLDRRAVTLRAVAIAALIVLVFRPEVLPEPGFQMSFAATTALVEVFGLLRGRGPSRLPKWARPVLAVVISSAVAGLATAPVAAANFNRIADYGLAANLLSVPLMGLVVMPGAVLAAFLTPFGLAWIGLGVMRPAIEWILGVAHQVAGMDGALTYVATPGAWVLPLMALGVLWAVLWRGGRRVRLAGLVPVALAFGLWVGVERPTVLISDTGGLVGVMTQEGRALSKTRGDGFSAKSWLENDGDGALQADAFARAGFTGSKGALKIRLAGRDIIHLSGRGAAKRVAIACTQADLVIVSVKIETAPVGCTVYDPIRLRETGALALWAAAQGVDIKTVRAHTGIRLWNAKTARSGSLRDEFVNLWARLFAARAAG